MKTAYATRLVGAGLILALAMRSPVVLGQTAAENRPPQATEPAQRQEKLQLVENDKSAYAASIVARWEEAAREAGRWDKNFATDLRAALTSLSTENLLAAGEASSYEAMMIVLATGRAQPAGDGPVTNFGDATADLVYTPVTPCRIVDTRLSALGALTGGVARTFDVDGASFATQGGNGIGCGIPFGVARAVTMTIVAVSPASPGYFNAWGLGIAPLSSVINYATGDVIANTAIIPVVPGSGNDFSLFSLASSHAVVDVLGYFAAPVATALDCTSVSSAYVPVPVNSWTIIDAVCPAGRTVTGGGHYTTEGSLGYPGVWLLSIPAGNAWRIVADNQTNGPRNISSWARCCRIPGR